MKSIARVLFMVLAFVPYAARSAAPLSGTKGSNLTAYNPNGSGAANNNNWNSMMNSRSSGTGTGATADFGNCNSVILRCASPKCTGGGCASMEIATPIVSGCVMSNSACKQYADQGLIETIAAQLVAQSTAKNKAQMAAAQAASAEQSAQQMEQMQIQMQQMQQQMAEQNAQQIEQLQSALAEQQELTAQAIADANAAQQSAANSSAAASVSGGMTGASGASGTTPTTVVDGLTESQRIAAAAGVSADILAREQVAGQIMSYIEDAQTNLKTAYVRMQEAFTYAGCDSKGDNCAGPKRVSVFRQKAMEFFEPYNSALDELYYALELAQTVGIDISDIYMMLDGSCNRWGQYLCNGGKTNGEWAKYTQANCPKDGGQSRRDSFSRGQNPNCSVGAIIPAEDSIACTMNRPLDDMEEVRRSWLYAEDGDFDENVRVGCMSSALQNTKFFRSRSTSQAMIDIETLQRIISQDAPAYSSNNRYLNSSDDKDASKLKYCALTSDGYMNLENAVATKKLPSRICVRDQTLTDVWRSQGQINVSTSDKLLGRSNTGATVAGYNEYTCKLMRCGWDSSNSVCNVPSGWYINDDGECVQGSDAFINALRQQVGGTTSATSNCVNSLTCKAPAALSADCKCMCGGQAMEIMQTCECNNYGICKPTYKYNL